MSEYQAKGKEGVNAERPEDKKGEKFNVTAVEGLKVKTGKKKKRIGQERLEHSFSKSSPVSFQFNLSIH